VKGAFRNIRGGVWRKKIQRLMFGDSSGAERYNTFQDGIGLLLFAAPIGVVRDHTRNSQK
jgi:hypothetical protein